MAVPGEIVCREKYGSSGKENIFVSSESRQLQLLRNVDETQSFCSSVSVLFKSAFLPQGYPDSVSQDYIQYQIWDSIQAFISRLMGTLSTREVLKGIGVGNENVTVLAATITWLLRDGTSNLARILFSWYESTSLDYNSKQWRLFADFMNDIASFFDLMASRVGMLSMPMLCLAGIFRATVDAAGGATRAAFVQHQARRGNLADVAAKDGSQETLVNLAGLVTSLFILPLVETNAAITWLLFVVLTSLHLLANYKAVKSVILETLNQLRLSILVTRFLDDPGTISGIREVNLAEPVILGRTLGKINLGCSFNDIAARSKDMESLYSLYSTSKYFLTFDTKTKEVFISLEDGCDAATEIESSFHAHVLFYYFRNMDGDLRSLWPYVEKGKIDQLELLTWSRRFVEDNYAAFDKSLSAAGWNTARTLLGCDEWRARWKTGKKNA